MQFIILRRPLLKLLIKNIENNTEGKESFLFILVFKVFRETPQIKFKLKNSTKFSNVKKPRIY